MRSIETSNWRQLLLITSLCLLAPAVALADPDGDKQPDHPKPRYKVPALMMVTWAEWPEDPKQQDVMAQFIRSNGFNCVEVEVKQLEMCRRNGLYARLGGEINQLLKDAAKLKDDKTVFGYFISDRRRSSSFPAFAKIARAYEKADPNHPTIFINRAVWNEHEAFIKQVKPMLFDFYHYHWQPRRNPERRYIYLGGYRELGQKHGFQIMRCVGGNAPLPQLRQTMYTSLAYGIKAFHFWPPWMFSINSEDGKPILKDGKIVPRVNVPPLAVVAKEIEPLGPVLVNLRATAVYHTKPVHPEAPGAASFPEDSWVQLEGEQLLVSLFKDANQSDYLMVVNCDAGNPRTVKVSLEPSVSSIERMDKKTGKWTAVELKKSDGRTVANFDLVAGSGELLRVTRK
jgi:hypothetical protein